MTTIAPYAWIKHLSPELLPKEGGPLLGFPPSFPWEAFVKQFADTFDLKDISFHPSLPELKDAEHLLTDLGTPLLTREFSIAPMKGPIWWVMSEQDVRFLMGFLLKKQTHNEFAADQDFLQAFVQFLTLEAIHAFQTIDYDKALSVQINEPATPPEGVCVGIDIRIQLPEDTINGRLLLSPQFTEEWKNHYAHVNKESLYQTPNAEYVEVVVHVEVGHTSLKTSEWKKVIPGDFVVLDKCTLKPGEENGRVLLTINGKPFFRGKLKEGNLKILEYPLYHELGEPMAKKNSDEDFDEDSDFEHTEDSEYDEDYTEDEDFDETEDDDSYDEDDSEEEDSEEYEDTEYEEDSVEETTEAGAKHAPAAPHAHAKKAEHKEEPKEAAPAAETGGEEKRERPSIDDIPLIVTAELARIQMSVKKLVELQPGNLLELNVHPEDGIDLVVNGKRVARGELLSLGEVLGVRVLEIG